MQEQRTMLLSLFGLSSRSVSYGGGGASLMLGCSGEAGQLAFRVFC